MNNYKIETVTRKSNPGCWDVIDITIKKDEEVVFEVTRRYSTMAEETTKFFELDGKEIVVYSDDYQTLNFFNLTDRQPIQLDEESKKQIYGFCPVEIIIPRYKIEDEWYEMDNDNGPLYHDFAMVSGCAWGDDSSWKLNIIDLKDLLSGKVRYVTNLEDLEPKWLYEELPSQLKLKDCFNIDYDWEEIPIMREGLWIHIVTCKRLKSK